MDDCNGDPQVSGKSPARWPKGYDLLSIHVCDYGHGVPNVKGDKMTIAGQQPRCPKSRMANTPVIGSRPDREAVAKRLLAMRYALSVDSAQIADAIGCDRSLYSKFENGKRDLTLAYAWKIHRIFGFTLDYTFDGKAHGIPGEHRQRVLAELA